MTTASFFSAGASGSASAGASSAVFDFVFVDADKNWYANYFRAVLPKLEVGGCFTAHNVSSRRMRGIGEFLDALEATPNLETEIVQASRSGISVSYKRSPS